MKAILLAAGLGTRLRPHTKNIPKCLMPINNIPLLHIWIYKLEKISIKEVLINTHYLPEQVIDSLKNFKTNINITLFHEDSLLGSAGTLIENSKFCDSDTILIHGDNLMEESLINFCISHRSRPKQCGMTMLTFETETPNSCGVLEINNNKVITKFVEKPKENIGNLANGAIYLISKKILDDICKRFPKASNFSTDIIPNYINKIYTYKTRNKYIDIGTYEQYIKAQKFKDIN